MVLAYATATLLIASYLVPHVGPVQAARPVVLVARAVPSVVPASGGTVEVIGRERNASMCRLKTLSSSGLSVGFSHPERTCKSTFRAAVTVGPNATGARQTIKLELTASSDGRSYAGKFYVTSRPAPTTTTTAPVPPITTPATAPVPPITTFDDENWAGYVVTGGPFQSAAGSFNVPEVGTASATSSMDIWVGIDGFASRSDLIQAGVMVSGSPCRGASRLMGAGTSGVYACPWTFVVQGGQMSEGPVPDLTVSPGDSISISVRQETNGTWSLEMTDSTTGQSWMGSVAYSGPGGSAEWVVEDPGVPSQGCNAMVDGFVGQCPMPRFSPVNFGGVSVTPADISAQHELLLCNEHGVCLAGPSGLLPGAPPSSRFSVSYGVL